MLMFLCDFRLAERHNGQVRPAVLSRRYVHRSVRPLIGRLAINKTLQTLHETELQ